MNDISKSNNDDTELNSTFCSIFTEINSINLCPDEVLFKDSIMVKMSVKTDWKKVGTLIRKFLLIFKFIIFYFFRQKSYYLTID